MEDKKQVVRKYVGMKDIETFSVTPFIELPGMRYYVSTVKRPKGKPKEVADTSSGEIGMFIPTETEQRKYFDDRAKYVKLFKEDMMDFPSLPNTASRLLFYILRELHVGREEITLDPSIILKEMDYKNRKSYYEGIFHLCKEQLIAKKVGNNHDYFVNPAKFFNGSRDDLMKAPARSDYAAEMVRTAYSEKRSGKGGLTDDDKKEITNL